MNCRWLIIFCCGLGSAMSAFSQGTVVFANAGAPPAAICGITPLPAGTNFMVELVYAPDGTPADEFDAVAVRLGPPTGIGPIPGFFSGGARTAPTTTPGGFGLFEVRVWDATRWPDYRTAMAYGDWVTLIGSSHNLRVDTGDPTTVPPGTPTPLASYGLDGIYVGGLYFCHFYIPEPPPWTLLSVGLICFAAYIRKRSQRQPRREGLEASRRSNRRIQRPP